MVKHEGYAITIHDGLLRVESVLGQQIRCRSVIGLLSGLVLPRFRRLKYPSLEAAVVARIEKT